MTLGHKANWPMILRGKHPILMRLIWETRWLHSAPNALLGAILQKSRPDPLPR